jgi:hypothetical protein
MRGQATCPTGPTGSRHPESVVASKPGAGQATSGIAGAVGVRSLLTEGSHEGTGEAQGTAAGEVA